EESDLDSTSELQMGSRQLHPRSTNHSTNRQHALFDQHITDNSWMLSSSFPSHLSSLTLFSEAFPSTVSQFPTSSAAIPRSPLASGNDTLLMLSSNDPANTRSRSSPFSYLVRPHTRAVGSSGRPTGPGLASEADVRARMIGSRARIETISSASFAWRTSNPSLVCLVPARYVSRTNLVVVR
ncbi:hypothetical protein PMAYCL1PPCAC_00866, partial [Pristionchus mayeri]